jgi:hypothetical protein
VELEPVCRLRECRGSGATARAGEYRQSCRLAMAAVAQQLDAAVAEAATARARLIYAEDATMAQLFGGLDGAMALDAIVKTYQDRSPTITMQ